VRESGERPWAFRHGPGLASKKKDRLTAALFMSSRAFDKLAAIAMSFLRYPAATLRTYLSAYKSSARHQLFVLASAVSTLCSDSAASIQLRARPF
jgi:hypothetical protein